MDSRAKLTCGLLGIGALSALLLGLGVGRPPRVENAGVAAIRKEIREETRFPGRALFVERKCSVCHGDDATGTAMGPGLGAVMPEYLAEAKGDEAEAKRLLVEYLKDPKGRPKLRRDTTRYPNPMPSAQGLGLTDGDLDRVVDYILHIKPAPRAVGGDALGR